MKELRRIYFAQKKKETVHHFMLAAVAGFLLSAVAMLAENMERITKR